MKDFVLLQFTHSTKNSFIVMFRNPYYGDLFLEIRSGQIIVFAIVTRPHQRQNTGTWEYSFMTS